MRDRLKRAYLDNLPGKNPTQTRFTRFLKTPGGQMNTAFNRATAKWDRLNDRPKTRFELEK